MKSERLRTVEHRQVGDERADLLEFLDARDLVADVELELVVEDGVREPHLRRDIENGTIVRGRLRPPPPPVCIVQPTMCTC